MNIFRVIITMGVLATMSCGGSAIKIVRQSDLNTWKGKGQLELETHPFFSQFEKKTQTLFDDSKLWIYSDCFIYNVSASQCNTISTDFFSSPKCYGGSITKQVCCHHQFLLRDNIVMQYRPVGDCFTDCKMASNPAKCYENERKPPVVIETVIDEVNHSSHIRKGEN